MSELEIGECRGLRRIGGRCFSSAVGWRPFLPGFADGDGQPNDETGAPEDHGARMEVNDMACSPVVGRRDCECETRLSGFMAERSRTLHQIGLLLFDKCEAILAS